MAEQIKTLADLAKLKAREEEEKNKVPYEAYLNNLVELVREGNAKVRDSVSDPKANPNHEYVCIKEPLEFMELFQTCSGQEEYVQLFTEMVESRDPRVVSQVIQEKTQPDGLWFNSTAKGINLRPGLRDEAWSSPESILLGDDAVHAMLAGRTGSGKSVFLNSILFSLMAEYSPWELDLFLVDFKKVEFKRYLSRYDVPHVKAVAATSEIRYVISLLNHLSQCMKARQDFFANIGLQKISEVRDRFGIVLPRVLLVVDEFQQLFLESTAKEQSLIQDILTTITKLGRATGYHLLFASQEMTGTLGSSVFGNFKVRFALACTADVSNAILGNSAAADIDKKGIAIANVGEGREGNRYFKVPYIDEDTYFFSYLSKITDSAREMGFKSVHKFYDEDSIKDFEVLETLLDDIKSVRQSNIDNSSSIFDIITLGDAVVFNYKKYDYETVFLERGVRKNIGVFSPSVDDTAYICKLLATNFMKSPRAGEYKNFILARNDLFTKKYDIVKELNPVNRSYSSPELLDDIVQVFKKRKREAALIQNFQQYRSLRDFAYAAFCLRTEDIAQFNEDNKEAFFASWIEPCEYFEGYEVKDIPQIKERLHEDFEFDESYFHIIDMLYEAVTLNKSVSELFEPYLVWVIGCEMVGQFPRELEEVLNDSTIYNMLFVLVASNIDFNDFYKLPKTCNYFFVSGNNESYYNKLKMPFTRKPEGSLAIDCAIDSTSTQKSFKKFKYELSEVIVPEIDFDSLLGENDGD